MKKIMTAVLAAGLASMAYGALQAGEVGLSDDQMGLSQTSVFDDPSPEAFQYPQTEPSASRGLGRAYPGAPPQVPHKVENFMPIRAGKNMCIVCHDKPELIGKARNPGNPTPMPVSHYAKLDDGSLRRSDARHVCVQCHAPQAEVKELVGNTFAQ